jgi:hypothetical protein
VLGQVLGGAEVEPGIELVNHVAYTRGWGRDEEGVGGGGKGGGQAGEALRG